MRRYLLTASLLVMLPTLVVAWTAGSFLASRLTEHVAQATSTEVAANAAAVLRQSGLATSSTGDSLVVFVDVHNALPSWQYFDTVMARNPNTLDLRVYDEVGRVIYARDRSSIGSEVAVDSELASAMRGKRETEVHGANAPIELFGSAEAARSYSVLIPLAYSNGSSAGVLEVTQDLSPIADDLAVARWVIVLLVAAVVLALTVLTAYFATRLARRSFFDPVTTLPNLSYLRSAADLMLEGPARARLEGGLILLDIDRFKAVNDTLGRPQGDRLLRDVADRLRAAVRGNDYVARVGGDDFAVLLPSADEAAMRRAAERAVAAVATPFRADGRDIRLEASAGVVLFPRDALELDGLLQRAELALERAKRSRRAIAFYRRQSDSSRRHSLYLESDLRSAIENEEIDVLYQPICYLPTGEIVGLEALARWDHPTRGAISPDTFVEIAESSGFVDRLDRWTLREATAQLATWSRLGSRVIVTVNMAAQTLSDPALPGFIEELLTETGAPAELLVLEVTERTALEGFESSTGVLARLKETGVGIALDDFGRGYSSLVSLDRLPISFLKLDASFTRGIGNSSKDEHLLKAVKLFTKGIGIPFIAEGIETEQQRGWLIQQGVRFGQGYLFSRPTARENIVPPRHGRGSTKLEAEPSPDPAAPIN